MTGPRLSPAALVQRVRARFPDEAARTDAWLVARAWEPEENPYAWLEAFADRTTEAISSENWPLVQAHTGFIASLLPHNADDITQFIDVAYAEHLMWNIPPSSKRRAWSHIAPAVRQLYEAMWGKP